MASVIENWDKFLSENFSMPFILCAMILAVGNILERNKCIRSGANKTFKDDNLVQMYYGISIFILVFCSLLIVFKLFIISTKGI